MHKLHKKPAVAGFLFKNEVKYCYLHASIIINKIKPTNKTNVTQKEII